jgi:alpha-tubulin suppressor-like RCC1 family protein
VNHTCAVDEVGALSCWGNNTFGQVGDGSTAQYVDTPVEIEASGWRQVSAGVRFSCGVKTDDTLWCWGYQADGRLGDGQDTSSPISAPQQVGTAAVWAAVSTSIGEGNGLGHACAVRTDGTLWCWGANGQGQTGQTKGTNTLVPTQVGTDSDWKDVRAGDQHNCARKTDDSGWCWGFNQNERLGEFVGDDTDTPVEAVAGATWDSPISAGFWSTCALRNGGELWCWGRTTSLGPTAPEMQGTETDWRTVSERASRRCATKTDGTMWCRADNTWGQGGWSGSTYDSDLQQVPGTNWATASTSDDHTCAELQNGDVRCFGSAFYGQLGSGLSTYALAPVALSGTWMAGRPSQEGACALDAAGALYCWGQTGLQPVGFSALPVDMGSTGYVELEAGGTHYCGLKADDTLHCWGQQRYAPGTMSNLGFFQTPTQFTTDTFVDVALGTTHSCAIKSDGTLHCWGANDFGQLGDGTTDDRNDLTQVGTDTDWERVFASVHSGTDGNTCAIKTDGRLYCWGAIAEALTSAAGPVLAPAQVGTDTDWANVASSWSFVVARKQNGELYSAGENDRGQLGDPARSDPDWTLTRVGSALWDDITVGGRNACGIQAGGTLWCWGSSANALLANGSLGGANATSPTQVGTASDWVEVRLNTETGLARRASGELEAFGVALDGAHGLGFSWTNEPQSLP